MPFAAENGYVMNSISDGYIHRFAKCIPVRAIPFITGGCIPATNVPKLLSCLDSLFTAPSFQSVDGEFERSNELEWRALKTVTSFDELPAGKIVELEDMNIVMRNCFDHFMTPYNISDGVMYSLPESCDVLTPTTFSRIMEGFVVNNASEHEPAGIRINSAELTREKITDGITKFQQICEENGIKFEFGRIPGTREQMFNLLKRFDPTIHISLDTFYGKDYLKHKSMSFKWIKGDHEEDGMPMVNVIEDFLALPKR